MSAIRQAAVSLAVTIPFCVWWTDTIFSVYKVKGKSMEPSLQDGDVILVRKSDLLPFFFPNPRLQHHVGTTITTPANATEYFISKHPTPFPGDVVVYKNPMAFPDEFIIKRVVGVGGQYVSNEKICVSNIIL
jgi:signal peptidase I